MKVHSETLLLEDLINVVQDQISGDCGSWEEEGLGRHSESSSVCPDPSHVTNQTLLRESVSSR